VWTRILAIALGYAALARAAQAWALPPGDVTPLWVASGFAFFAVHELGRAAWPGVVLGAWIAHSWTVFDARDAGSAIVSTALGLAIAGGALLQAEIGVRLTEGWRREAPLLATVRGAIGFGIAVALSSVVGAAIAILALHVGDLLDPERALLTWLAWYLGDTVGTLVVAPALIALRAEYATLLRGRAQAVEWGGLLLLTLLSAGAVRGAAWSALLVAIIAALGTASRAGPFDDPDQVRGVLTLQLFLSCMALTAVALGAAVLQRIRAESQLARTNLELAERNRDMERFAFAASHDLKEPLRAITQFSDLLHLEYGDKLDEEGRQYLGFLGQGARKMTRLVTGLREYTRVSMHALPLADCDLDLALDAAKRTLSAEIERTSAEIESVTLPIVRAAPEHMVLLFRVLLENSLRFAGGERPRVHLDAAEVAEGWRVSVRDRGAGLDMAYAERIFGIFERLGPGEGAHGPEASAGLGLALARRIVERHGGRIWVESAPGQGASFHFTLPKRSEPPK